MYCSCVVWKTNHRICFQLASTVPEDVYLDIFLSYQYRFYSAYSTAHQKVT